MTLTNGHLPGYCVTQAALEEGGYEPGNSILAPASGRAIVDAAVDLLNRLATPAERDEHGPRLPQRNPDSP
ncbi:hypothetical protein G7085_12050 [Tessaracoccus sp. HDW20]|uniref:hypothetical protein n=1 Tax=Tessaracoccus coleopterorum TaxID=2714950 RepID=UPI0018D47232|nr:hypothetical protein [Tessaracoccus coleopterorum]NHB85101.1 hypothetical protein [Tessaracoccus coleopterorum]